MMHLISLSLSDPQAVSKYAESEVNIHYRAPIRTEVRYY